MDKKKYFCERFTKRDKYNTMQFNVVAEAYAVPAPISVNLRDDWYSQQYSEEVTIHLSPEEAIKIAKSLYKAAFAVGYKEP